MREVQEPVFIYRLGGGGVEDFEGEHNFQGISRRRQSI